jgi:ABC-2 type transport system permease protein
MRCESSAFHGGCAQLSSKFGNAHPHGRNSCAFAVRIAHPARTIVGDEDAEHPIMSGHANRGSRGSRGCCVSVAGVVLATVLMTTVLDLAASVGVAAAESQPIMWPGFGDLAVSIGAGFLILGMWAAIGVLVSALTRSPAVAIGLGLVWSFVVENLLRGAASLLSGLEYVTNVLPGTAVGSLTGSLKTSGAVAGDGAPGVLTVLDGPVASLVTSVYLVVAVVATVLVVRRRDVS